MFESWNRRPTPVLHAEHAFYQGFVGLVYQAVNAQMTLAGFRLFGQQVAFEGFVPADFTRTGYSESLLCTRVRFHFCHVLKFLGLQR
jgi:hypothetical protein